MGMGKQEGIDFEGQLGRLDFEDALLKCRIPQAATFICKAERIYFSI
jgi:hypothetical protein